MLARIASVRAVRSDDPQTKRSSTICICLFIGYFVKKSRQRGSRGRPKDKSAFVVVSLNLDLSMSTFSERIPYERQSIEMDRECNQLALLFLSRNMKNKATSEKLGHLFCVSESTFGEINGKLDE